MVIWDESTILVGINNRTNRSGFAFLRHQLAGQGFRVLDLEHECLHLDCCLAPLGLGHLLIHPESLRKPSKEVQEVLTRRHEWIEVDKIEREHLTTNVLSIAPDTVIARDNTVCLRANQKMAELGYTVETVRFDGAPATGGSFRCASLALLRE